MSDLEARTKAVQDVVEALLGLSHADRLVVLDAARAIVGTAPERPRLPAMPPKGGAIR